MTGDWPPEFVDHKDGDGLNNRWANLRIATHSQNMANCGPTINNTTGKKGVMLEKRTGRYYAQIKANRRHIHLGTFDTAEQAHVAYAAAAKQHFGEFARAQ